MTLTPDMIVLATTAAAAMLLGVTITLVCSRFAFVGKGTAPVSKTSLRVAIAQQRALPKLRRMLPAQIAERVVASIRATGCNAFALIPEDLDDFIAKWCADNMVECPPGDTVKNLIKQVPGVKCKRIWLNKSSSEHHYIRERQRVKGKPNERPTLYWISDLPDTVMDKPTDRPKVRARAVSDPCPYPVQSVQAHDRTRVGQSPVSRPVERRRAA